MFCLFFVFGQLEPIVVAQRYSRSSRWSPLRIALRPPAGTHARRKRDSSAPNAGAETPEAQAALEARTAALVSAWLADPVTVQPEQMSETERRRFFSGLAKLARSSLIFIWPIL